MKFNQFICKTKNQTTNYPYLRYFSVLSFGRLFWLPCSGAGDVRRLRGYCQYIILLGIIIANNIITSFNSFSAHRWITENPPYELMCSSLRTDKTQSPISTSFWITFSHLELFSSNLSLHPVRINVIIKTNMHNFFILTPLTYITVEKEKFLQTF